MPTKRYDLVFQGIDRTSSVVGLIDSRIGTMTRNVGQAGQAFTGLGEGGMGSMLLMGAGIAAVSTALLAAGAIATGFKNQLQAGIDAQLSQIGAAIDGSVILGTSIDRTEQIIEKLTQTVARNTATLPGATSNYTNLARQIYDEVIPAARDLNGALDEKVLIDKTDKVAKLFGFMGAKINASMGDITSAATKALSGALTLGEMNQLDIFAQNPLFKKRITQALKDQGVSQLKELNEKQRVELFEKLSIELVSPQAQTKLAGTFQGKMEGLMSTIFDDTLGILGFNNALTGRGNRKVIDAATSVLGEIGDIFEELGNVFQKAGLNEDSVGIFLYDRLQDFANFLDTIQRVLEENEGFFAGIVQAGLYVGDVLGRIWNFSYEWYSTIFKVIFGVLKIILPFLGKVVDQFGDVLNWIYEYLSKVVTQFSQLVDSIGDAAAFIGNAISAGFNYVKRKAASSVDFVFNAFDRALTGVTSLFDFISAMIQGRVDKAFAAVSRGLSGGSSNGVSSGNASSNPDILGTVTNALSLSGVGTIASFASSAVSGIQGLLGNITGANYDGYIPSSLLSLSQTESQFNPNGGRQFITSENEYVLTPAQMANLISNVQASAQKNFYINVQTMSEQQFADMIVQSINKQWVEATSSG